MSNPSREFVFIMLKPTAVANKRLNNYIKKTLLMYGDIKHSQEAAIKEKSKIAEHYQGSQGSFWYPLLINYLFNKVVEYFILESKLTKKDLVSGNTEYSFADFLRKQIIGPANIFQTKKNHIRRLAIRISPTFLLDNLIHCSANTKEAVDEIRIWYKEQPTVIEEYETKALTIGSRE